MRRRRGWGRIRTEEQVRVELEVVVGPVAELHRRVGLDGGKRLVVEEGEALSGGKGLASAAAAAGRGGDRVPTEAGS